MKNSFARFLTVFVLSMMISFSTVSAQSFEQGMVSLNFDDGWQSFFDTAKPILDEAGFKSTIYVITGEHGSNLNGPSPENGYMDAGELSQLQSQGHDIAAHSRNHPAGGLTGLDEETLASEIQGSRDDLLNHGFSPVDNYAYPEGIVDPTIKAAVQAAGFSGARGIGPSQSWNDKSTDPFDLNSYEVSNDTPIETIQSLIDSANTDKRWLVLFFHKVEPTCEEAKWCVTADKLQTVVDYLKSSNTPVVTMSQGLALLQSGSGGGGGEPLDTTPPIITGLVDDSTVTTSKTWTWGANEAATFRFAIDQSPEWTPTGAYEQVASASQMSGEGLYYIHVQAKDTAGNESEVVTVSALLGEIPNNPPADPEPEPPAEEPEQPPVVEPDEPQPAPSTGGGGGGGGSSRRRSTAALFNFSFSNGQVLGAETSDLRELKLLLVELERLLRLLAARTALA